MQGQPSQQVSWFENRLPEPANDLKLTVSRWELRRTALQWALCQSL